MMEGTPVPDLVVTPQKVEYDRARNALTADQPPSGTSDPADSSMHILHSGVGPEKTKSSLNDFLERHRPDRALVTGFCASLERSLDTGDVLLARYVYSHPDLEAPERIPTDVNRLKTKLNKDHSLKIGSLLTVPNPVFERKSKRSLKNSWDDCHALDTETAVAGRLLAERGVPFIAARVVLDSLTDDLSFIKELIQDHPEPPPREVFTYVLSNPSTLVPFSNLSRKYLIASRRLNQFLDDFFQSADVLDTEETGTEPDRQYTDSRL